MVTVKMYIPKLITSEENEPSSAERNERIIRCNQREIRSSIGDNVLRTSLDTYHCASSRSTRHTLGPILEALDHLSQIITPEQRFIGEYDDTQFNFGE